MPNPFTFGAVVLGDDFANRKNELKELTRKLKETVRIFLVAPRRYGKTSLAKNALAILKNEGMLTAYIDLYGADSSNEFMELYATNILRSSRSIATRIMDSFRNLRPTIGIDEAGTPQISLVTSPTRLVEATDEIFDLPERIARKEKKRFIVVIDEIQEIFRFNVSLVRQMKASIQHHSNVSYLFTGSESPKLMDTYADHTHPFYQIGTLMKLDKIQEKDFIPFIQSKFMQSGKNITQAALSRLLQESANIPHCVQFICFNLWDHFRDVSTIEEIHVIKALSLTLRGQEPSFHLIWEGLTTYQKNVLKVVSELKGRDLASKNTIRQFDLESLSLLKRNLNTLISKRILRKEKEIFIFEDTLFGKWIEFGRCAEPLVRKLTQKTSTMEWDVFISHATEDKDEFVRPLAEALRKLGIKVWYDEFTLRVGDSLRRSIDQGLNSSRYGIVVISQNFLEKQWPQKELDGLTTREDGGRKVILPVWHNINAEQICQYSPTLADRVATLSKRGINRVINDLLDAMKPSS